MSKISSICKDCENLSPEERTAAIGLQAEKVLQKVAALNIPEVDPKKTLVAFIMGAIVSDGKVNEEEYAILYPVMTAAFGTELGYEQIKFALEKDKTSMKSLKESSINIAALLGGIDSELQTDIILLCLLITAVDGKISMREKSYLKQFFKD